MELSSARSYGGSSATMAGAAEAVEPLASQVFDALSNGCGTLNRAAFQRCSSSLAQLSPDFQEREEDMFNRFDANADEVIERKEFLEEVQNMRELLGTRKLAGALAQVCAELREEEEEKEKEKENRRQQAEDLGSLEVRGRVMRKMMSKFDAMRDDYTKRLEDLEATCRTLRSKVGTDGDKDRTTPFAAEAARGPRTRPPRKEKKRGQPAVAASAPGTGGVGDAAVQQKGGDAVAEPNESREAPEVEVARSASHQNCDEEDEDEREGEEGEDEDEDEEEDEEEEPAEDDSAGEEEGESEDEDDEDEEEDEDDEDDEDMAAFKRSSKQKRNKEASDSRTGKEIAEQKEETTQELSSSPGAEVAAAAADDANGEAAVGASAAAAATPAAAAEAAAQAEADAGATAAASASSSSAPVAAAGGEVAPAPSQQQDDADAKPAASKAKAAKAKKKKKQQQPRAKQLAKELSASSAAARDEEGDARDDAPLGGYPSPSEAAATTPTAASPTASPAAKKRGAKGKVTGGASDDVEGVRCVQELALGLAIRSAICVGKEVWTSDQVGRVAVRERDNAAKIVKEVPTHRFVICMCLLEPGLILLGMEEGGIAVFDIHKRDSLGLLMNGHGGSVACLAMEDGLAEDADESGHLPTRRLWSGSNDFTIRQWTVQTWQSNAKPPPAEEGSNAKLQVFAPKAGKFKVGVTLGTRMHGHKNGVRCLLRIGPILWSGSDDGSIRLWYTAESACGEVIENAHRGTVLKLRVVRSYVWSSGSDGLIKEWTIGGKERQLTRQVAPPGSDRGVYAILPIGHDVWTCGHHPRIQIYSQKTLQDPEEIEAHESYVSDLLLVDRVETKIVWSTSIGDKKLKVWRNTIRGNEPSLDEMKAANRLYEEEQENQAGRLKDYAAKNSELRTELSCSEEEYQKNLDALAGQLATAQGELDALEARKRALEAELAGMQRLFEDAGLGKLLEDPAAMRAFLERAAELEKVLKDLGLGHLLEDPEELRRMLEAMGEVAALLERSGFGDVFGDPAKLAEFRRAMETLGQLRETLEAMGFGDVLTDPSKLREALDRMQGLKELLEQYGFGDALSDPSKLKEALDTMQALRDMLEQFGFGGILDDPAKIQELQKFLESARQLREILQQYGHGEAFDDPSILAEILSRYNGMKQAFEEYGFGELFEDPYTLRNFLRNYSKIREAFQAVGLEYLLDSNPAMRDFLKQHGQGEQELKEVRLRAARVEELEETLKARDAALAKAAAEAKALKERLAAFEAIGSLEDFGRWKRDAKEYQVLRKQQANMSGNIDELRRQLQQKEQERQEALERERVMSLKYKELDIFKLDIIARELKELDKELGFVGKEVKMLDQDAKRLKNYDEQQQITLHGGNLMDQCHQLRGHIRDVINKCLSETQKLHIGAAIDDPTAAGELKDGGVMVGYVVEEVDRPDHGRSRAAHLRQQDEVSRDRRKPSASPRPGARH